MRGAPASRTIKPAPMEAARSGRRHARRSASPCHMGGATWWTMRTARRQMATAKRPINVGMAVTEAGEHSWKMADALVRDFGQMVIIPADFVKIVRLRAVAVGSASVRSSNHDVNGRPLRGVGDTAQNTCRTENRRAQMEVSGFD